jgi:hypothetical protein
LHPNCEQCHARRACLAIYGGQSYNADNQKEGGKSMENEKVADVPYIIHEAEMARMERVNTRLFWAWVVTLILLIGCVAGFIWYEAQFVEEENTVTQDIDTGNGNLAVTGIGDLYYGESTSNSKNAQENP